MLITLFAWLYITILCSMWGMLLLKCVKIISGNNENIKVHFSIVCFLGLAGVTIFSSLLSLFMPLGGWLAQLLIIIPCLFLFVSKPEPSLLKSFKRIFSRLNIIFILLFFACILLLLIMSIWKIANEDTLGYHAQVIEWIEKYKVVPGIANLHTRYGLQSSWFIACALFSFQFLKTNALTFINSTVLLWYLFFVISQINRQYFSNKINCLPWLLILIMSLWSYTQVRLTATSGNPDFVATLYIWLIFYLFLTKIKDKPSTFNLSLIIVTSVFALTIKLSTVPVIIFIIYCTLKLIFTKRIRTLVFCLVISIFILIPFVTRNIISSGYAAFPLTFPDIANVDWKLDKGVGVQMKKYITAYARTHSDSAPSEIGKIDSMKIGEWVPVWWKNQSLADKTIIILMIISCLTLAARIKIFFRSNQRMKIALATSLAGIIFWFIQAPDPRFGFGFMIALPAIVWTLLLPVGDESDTNLWKKVIVMTTLPAVAMISAYIIYRTLNFFSPPQLLLPKGITPIKYNTIKCDEIDINIPETLMGCGDTNVPCAYDSCKTFEPRGKKITDGFKAK